MQFSTSFRATPRVATSIYPHRNQTLHQRHRRTHISKLGRRNCRCCTFEAGDNRTGHIHAAPNQTLLFYTNIFPLRLAWLLRLPFQGQRECVEQLELGNVAALKPHEFIKKALSDQTGVRVEKVFPRINEGGAFIKLRHGGNVSDTSIEHIIRNYLKNNPIRPWWNPFQRVHTRLVRGRPWVEDLHRPPSCRLKVEFAGEAMKDPELTQEQLYSVFRPYGKLIDITPQPSDSKDSPKFAFIDFENTRSAVMARNCLHGLLYKDQPSGKALAKLMISYQRRARANWLKDWIMNHPRIVIPIVAALIAMLTVAVFDPIRTFYIKIHITRALLLTDNWLFGRFISRATNFFSFKQRSTGPSGMEAFEENRKGSIEQLQRWLMESADTFIVVQGPRGTGKKELVVDEALQNRRPKLVIDCKPIQEAHGDRAIISAMAQQVGYRPVFSWVNSLSGLIDLAAQGATGMKTGFSETLDTQLAKILNNTATALKQVGLDSRKRDGSDTSMDDDLYLEAHPERRPVVVIDNFLHKSQDGSIVYEKVAEWAAQVTTANVAHVVFLTTDVSFAKSLSRALPGRVFRQLLLEDAGLDAAKRFVMSRLVSPPEADTDTEAREGGTHMPLEGQRVVVEELDECISSLGGRLTDLEFLARRIKAGETPKKAVDEIIGQSTSEIIKMYLSEPDDKERKWTSEQAWVIISKLAEHNSVRYNEIGLADGFDTRNYERVIQALEQAELITVVSQNGRPSAIKPSRPVYGPAFKMLTRDVVLSSRFKIGILSNQIKGEISKIEKSEAELTLLSQLPKQSYELTTRIHYLLNNVQTSQGKIQENERNIALLRKTLESEF